MSLKRLPFIYKETFTHRTIEAIPEEICLDENRSSELLVILRVLSGTADIVHKNSGIRIKQRKNYFSTDLKSYNSHWPKRFPKIISSEHKASDIASYVENNKRLNRRFYKNVLLEISNFILQTEKGSHTSAFIYIYRLLENIAYAFPLIYVSKTNDFSKSYDYLKNLMDENRTGGEKDFLKKFIEVLYKDDPQSEATFDFDIKARSESDQKKIFEMLYQLCKKDMLGDATLSPRTLSIRFTEVGSFLINIRNRFFHFSNNGQKNIDSETLYDSDYVFSLINCQFMQWISNIFMGIFIHNFEQYESLKKSISQNT
ncbi:hypothetical protein FH712_09955 [Marinobacter nauticus]|uniref:hypothetical protein n=1 Tax=Marinobacter nauticus TaxID=2743 RepID=UPI00112FC491|nr:hypothetical protein [Marinobacter nauticus]TPW24231.1 hypothetical protein FH712_09955 [Marinobacter nauticus]